MVSAWFLLWLVTTRVVTCTRSVAVATRICVRAERRLPAATRPSDECISCADDDAKSRLTFCQLLLLPDEDDEEKPAEPPPPQKRPPMMPVAAVAPPLPVLLRESI